jgi:cytochrome P450
VAVTAYDEVDFYSDASLVDDPHQYFAHLRARGPAVHLPHNDVVAVTTYDEAAEVLRDHQKFSSCTSIGGPLPGFSVDPRSSDDVDDFIAQHRDEVPMGEYLITMDPPSHQAQRALVMRLLTPKRMRENEAFLWSLADQQIDEFIDGGSVEIFHDYAEPFALLAIADLLGVPEADHREFRKQLSGGLPQVGPEAEGQRLSNDPLAYLQARFAEYIEGRRREPRRDVLTQLATATYPDGTVPDVEVVCRMATFLFAAGQDTTARLITTALRYLAEEPKVQAFLRADSDRIPNFIEEVLRHHGVVKHIGRLARVDTAIAGVEVPAGSNVGVLPSSANRDPSRFEEPDEFRPDRQNAMEHLAFGRGIHACPGAPLSRIEAKVSIERFLARTSDITLDEEHHGAPGARRFEFEPIYIMQGLRALHLQLTPADRNA